MNTELLRNYYLALALVPHLKRQCQQDLAAIRKRRASWTDYENESEDEE